MRLLFLAHAPSIHARRWTEALARRGHQVRLLSAHPGPGLAVPVRVIGFPWPIHALRYASTLRAVRDEIRAFRPDVTIAHFLPNYGFLAALAGARPFVLACWGSDVLVNAWRTPLHRARARYVLRRSDLVHVDAAVLGDAAIRLGADPSRVWCRAWGVEEAMMDPPAARDGGDPDAVRVLWTRHFEPVYDPATFVRALGVLKRRGGRMAVTMAGEGSLRGAIERGLREEGISESVSLLGLVPSDRLRELYRSGDLYVSLSRSDSTSQSLLEAMAAGLFPIVSDIPGNREWVTHRRHGYLVPVGDPDAVACAILEAARDPDSDAIRARARAEIEARGRFEDTLDLLEMKLTALAGTGTEARAAGPTGTHSA